MLDQKLDQMLLMLQENGVAPHSPTRGSPTAALQDPTVLKAQQAILPPFPPSYPSKSRSAVGTSQLEVLLLIGRHCQHFKRVGS